jgi:hypothetical protein
MAKSGDENRGVLPDYDVQHPSRRRPADDGPGGVVADRHKFMPGDWMICRSDVGVEGLVTVGKRYRALSHEGLSNFLKIVGSPSLMVTVDCDDGQSRSVNKLRFVPDTQAVAKRGKLELHKIRR